MAGKLAVLASSPADYQRLGLSPTSIAAWEDGARTDDAAGTYEWWYFDAIKGVKRIAARLARFDGAYLRFTGDVEISRYRSSRRCAGLPPRCHWGGAGSRRTARASRSAFVPRMLREPASTAWASARQRRACCVLAMS